MGVNGSEWEWVAVHGSGGSAWEWVGTQFSINHFYHATYTFRKNLHSVIA